jgi:hypothetical protein
MSRVQDALLTRRVGDAPLLATPGRSHAPMAAQTAALLLQVLRLTVVLVALGRERFQVIAKPKDRASYVHRVFAWQRIETRTWAVHARAKRRAKDARVRSTEAHPSTR